MALTRLPGFTLDSNSSFTFANANVTANVTAGNVKTDNLLYANGSPWSFGSTYSNANVALYLPTYTGQMANALVAGTVYTNAQPNITSVGTLSSLTVTGLITATAGGIKVGNLQDTSGTNTVQLTNSDILVTGNISAGAGGTGNVTATYFIGNGSQLTSIAATTAATVTTNAQPNITSVGTLTSLSVTANITSGNINGGNAIVGNYFVGNGSLLTGLPASYSNTNVASYLPTYTGSYTGNTIALTGTPLTNSAYMNGSSYVIVPGTGLLPSSGSYTVEFWMKTNDTSWEIFASEVSGLAIFISSGNFYYQYSYGTGGPITVSASSILDNNWHHVALVRNSTTVTLYFDGVSKGTASDNTDYSSYNAYPYDIGYGNQSAGRYLTGYLSNFRVVNGTAVYTSAFTPPTSPLTAISGTTLLTFQDSTLIDNSSLAKSLTTSGTVTYGSTYVPFSGLVGGTLTATGNITTLNANLGNLATANYFSGSGNLLSNIQGANISGTVASATIAGTVTTNAQPNITSVGTLTSLSVTANITGGNITSSGALAAADLSASGNAIISGNLTVGGTTSYVNVTTLAVKDPIIEQGGGANGDPLTTNDGKDRGSLLHYYTTTPVDAFMGWDNSNAEFAFGSNVSVSSEVVTFNTLGNVRASTFIGALSGAATTAATVTTNAQPNITSIGTLTSLSVTGNVTAGNLITSGNISGANYVTANYFVGDGSLLTGLPASYANANVANYLPTYTGNFSPSNLAVSTSANLGAVGNVIITGGSANYVLTTNGSGTLSWAAQSGGGSSTSTTIAVDNFTGNGVADTYTLSVTPTSVNSVFVNYNGAFVGRGSYSLSGANLTFGSVPANGASIEVTTIEGLTIGSGAFTTRTATGDGSETDYTVTSGATASSVLATLDGVLQTPTTDYTISGTTLTFTTAPYNGAAIQIRELAVASSSGGTGGASRAVAMTMGIIFGG